MFLFHAYAVENREGGEKLLAVVGLSEKGASIPRAEAMNDARSFEIRQIEVGIITGLL
jgi:hypothetical protein